MVKFTTNCSCSYRGWCFFIGGSQVLGGILLAALCIFLLSTDETNLNSALVSSAVLIFNCFLNILAGVLLILGVWKKEASKLLMWIIMATLILAFAITAFVFDVVTQVDTLFSLEDAVGITLLLIFIWVVFKFRDELMKGNAHLRNDEENLKANGSHAQNTYED